MTASPWDRMFDPSYPDYCKSTGGMCCYHYDSDVHQDRCCMCAGPEEAKNEPEA